MSYHEPYVRVSGSRQRAHRAIVEDILGRKLKGSEGVHHVDENKRNNAHSNLVVYPDQAYHSLLHQRRNALLACGNANARPCKYCHSYEPLVDRMPVGTGAYHLACAREYDRMRWAS